MLDLPPYVDVQGTTADANFRAWSPLNGRYGGYPAGEWLF